MEPRDRAINERDLPLQTRIAIFRGELNRTIGRAKRSGLMVEEERTLRDYFGGVLGVQLLSNRKHPADPEEVLTAQEELGETETRVRALIESGHRNVQDAASDVLHTKVRLLGM